MYISQNFITTVNELLAGAKFEYSALWVEYNIKYVCKGVLNCCDANRLAKVILWCAVYNTTNIKLQTRNALLSARVHDKNISQQFSHASLANYGLCGGGAVRCPSAHARVLVTVVS